MRKKFVLANFLKKINRHNYMPVIWLTLLAIIIWIVCPLLYIPIVWRVGIVFVIFNSSTAYIIGRIIERRQLNRWWLLLFPIIFAISVTIHYAQYNYLFCVIYLCIELFGLWHDNFYRKKDN